MTKFSESHGRIYLVDAPPTISDRLATDSYALKVDPSGELFEPTEMKIEVRNNGRIVITNAEGDEVVLERMTHSFAKKF